jgi:hypothetical protein
VTKPRMVTFTGVDDKTDIAALVELSKRYPIEWGVLVGGRLGKNRYPSWDTIQTLRVANVNHGIRLSQHLCGEYAVAANTNSTLKESLGGFQRVQVNLINYDLDALARVHRFTRRDIIVQHRHGPFPELPPGVLALHDQSGGKGKLPTKRPPQTDMSKPVGYAGGINPENVAEVIEQIAAASYWLDMETGVRTDDWFDLSKCEAVCRAIWS